MKYGLMTYDENGNRCMPLWTGEEWHYFQQNGQRGWVRVEGPLDLVLLPTAKGYEGRLFIYQDDGTSPDPRTAKPDPYVTTPLRVRYRSPAARPLEADEIRRDLEYLIETKLDKARRDVQALTLPAKKTLADVEGVPETNHSHLADESYVDVMGRCRAACDGIDHCADCGPDEDCAMPEGYAG